MDMDTDTDTDILKKTADFKFLTGRVKAYVTKSDDGVELMYLEGIASSTVIDRTGDRITLSAQEQMLNRVRSMTMFLNHSYNVPEDVLGSAEDSRLVAAHDPEQGDCFDLVIKIRINARNPRAVECFRSIQDGTQLSLSVGGSVTDYQITNDIFEITGMDLFEVSLVGIPANQRAIITQVVKSLRKSAIKSDDLNSVIVEPLSTEVSNSMHLDVEKTGRSISEANAGVINKCIKSMDLIKEHGMCDDIKPHLEKCYSLMKSLLPEGYEGDPSDPEPTIEDPSGESDLKNADVISEKSEVVDIVKTEDAISAKVVSEIDIPAEDETAKVLTAELAKARAEIEILKSMPAGRATQGPGSSEMNLIEKRSTQSEHSLMQDLARRLRG